MSNFLVLWGVAALVLLALAVYVGHAITKMYLGIFIDNRGRFSLTHLQVVMWTIVILSAFVATLIVEKFDITKVKLSPELLGLMGIASGSAVLATGVKAAKDAPGSQAQVARAGTVAPQSLMNVMNNTVQPQTANPTLIKAHFTQIWLEEEGALADQAASITKFQNFIFTLVALAVFVALAIELGGLPTKFPEYFVALLGISHAGYVGGKIPNKR